MKFEWEANKKCKSYQVLVSEYNDFSDLVYNENTENLFAEWEVEDEGKYYWYIKCSLSKKQFIGSKVREINVYE